MVTDDQISLTDPTARASVSREEMAVAFSGPSYAAGKFYITLGPTGVRIAFAEVSPLFGQAPLAETLSFRTAVTLPVMDAIALHRILRELLSETEAAAIEQGVIAPEKS